MKVEGTFKKILITVLVVILGYMVCGWLYVLIDKVINGFVVDWFESNYVNVEWCSAGEHYFKSIRWGKVKRLMLQLLVLFVTLSILAARLVSVLYASRQKKKALCAVSKMINDYMHQETEVSAVFPAEYAEISAQMAEIKAAMQANEQMLKAEASRKNDLITYLAHDLKTPLTSVIGYLSLLDEVPEMPEMQKGKYVHIALDKALRLEKLINEFFEITRYNLQQIILDKEMVDLPFMLEQMTDEFYPILSAHGNTIKLELQSPIASSEAAIFSETVNTGMVITDKTGSRLENQTKDLREGTDSCFAIYADAEKLARVFNNILKNAIAYSYPDTEIQVNCKVVDDSVQIAFSNRGKTIPPQKLDAIFEKFFRLDDARATNTGGAGLGLAIAKEIVTLHGGTISAESENGITVFKVELPLKWE